MAAMSSGSGGGYSRNGRSQKSAISEINVTPFVDVMLVLLVIFMITAPMMFSGILLELPKTKKVNTLQLNAEQVILSISSAGEYYLGKTKFLPEELIGEIAAQFKKNDTNTVYVRAHFELPYGQVAKLMSFLKRNGISNIALVTEVEKE